MKKIIFFASIIALIACNENTPTIVEEVTTIQGKVDNYTDQDMWLIGYNSRNKIEVDSNGTFLDSIEVGDGYFTFYLGRQSELLYINKGDKVILNFDANDFEKSLNLSGVDQAILSYMKEYKMLMDSTKKSNADLYALEESEFIAEVNSYKDKKMSLLQAQSNLPPAFIKTETDNITYDLLAAMGNYQEYYAYYADKEGFKASAAINDQLADIAYDDEATYTSVPSFRKLVDNHYSEGIYGDESLAKANSLLSINSPSIKNSMAKSLIYALSPSNENMDSLYAIVKQLSNDKDFSTKLDEKYEKLQKLTKGSPSPTFENYENHKGGSTSLGELRGKYTYIDVWATWCGPCIGEIPSLKKVEKQFHDHNIQFLSVSIDKPTDHDKWHKMVLDKELGGIQLMADNAWESDFVKQYVIDGIPRFILLDPEGNIVSADAPRPSDEALIELFEELKI